MLLAIHKSHQQVYPSRVRSRRKRRAGVHKVCQMKMQQDPQIRQPGFEITAEGFVINLMG